MLLTFRLLQQSSDFILPQNGELHHLGDLGDEVQLVVSADGALLGPAAETVSGSTVRDCYQGRHFQGGFMEYLILQKGKKRNNRNCRLLCNDNYNREEGSD